jgi:hypothetical protein
MTDRMLFFSERQLRIALARYALHYNSQRPHRALQLRPPRPQTPIPTQHMAGSSVDQSLAA